jgi:O-antigen ligase
VVGAADGMRWLRAYGTLPHPNLLGGVLAVYMGVVLERYIANGRRVCLGISAVGAATAFLTFSRGAWVGLALLGACLLLMLPRAGLRRAREVLAVAGLAFGALALGFGPIVLARVGAVPAPIKLEARSTGERLQLLRYGLQAIREHPLGLGAGTFAEWVYRIPGQPAPFEPVHNVPMLVAAEIGIPGALAGGALLGLTGWRIWQRRRAMGLTEAAWAATLVSALAMGLVDHYWWTMGPMRILLVLAFGLWVRNAWPASADSSAPRP